MSIQNDMHMGFHKIRMMVAEYESGEAPAAMALAAINIVAERFDACHCPTCIEIEEGL